MLFEYNGMRPRIGKNVFIAPTAVVIGDVTLGDNASVWYGAVLRGDMAEIRAGKNTNIQDNCTVHTDFEKPALIGDNVTVGHNAVVHGCIVEDGCLIGIGALVLTGAHVKTGSVIAAGSVVREGQTVGPRHLAAGIPAAVKREISEAMRKDLEIPVNNYLRLSAEHLAKLRPCD